MMSLKVCKTLFVVVILSLLSTSVFAVSSSSPAGKATDVPGLKVEGDASGTKLNGVIAISFSAPYCDEGYEGEYGTCDVTKGVNAANAIVAVRLSETNDNHKGMPKAVYFDLGMVPIWDVPTLQEDIITEIKPWILEEFFGVFDPDTMKLYNIYMKDFSRYVQANDSAFPSDTIDAPSTVIMDIILAIN